MGRPRLARYKNAKKKRLSLMPFLIPLVVVASIIFAFFFFLRPKLWDGSTKLPVVINGESDIWITTFDPTLDEVTTIKIPGNTEVEVSRNLGVWKLSSVWKLGKNEKVGGRLLQETIVKNFGFPVVGWASGEARGIADGELSTFFASIIAPYDTNLSYLDKIRLYMFSVAKAEVNQAEIDLAGTSLLKKTKLKGGEEGYVVGAVTPTRLIGIFSDSEISAKMYRISISDSSNKPGLPDEIGGIVENLGAKVVSKTIEKEADLDCNVVTLNKDLGRRISEIFHCSVENKKPDGNFDLVIEIGKKFAERF